METMMTESAHLDKPEQWEHCARPLAPKFANARQSRADLHRNVDETGPRPHLLGSGYAQGRAVEAQEEEEEEAGSTPFCFVCPEKFALNRWKQLHLEAPWRTCRESSSPALNRHVSIRRKRKRPRVSAHQLISDHEERTAEFFGSEEPVPFRHQYQNQGHGWVALSPDQLLLWRRTNVGWIVTRPLYPALTGVKTCVYAAPFFTQIPLLLLV